MTAHRPRRLLSTQSRPFHQEKTAIEWQAELVDLVRALERHDPITIPTWYYPLAHKARGRPLIIVALPIERLSTASLSALRYRATVQFWVEE